MFAVDPFPKSSAKPAVQQVQYDQTPASAPTSEFDSVQRNNVLFANPGVIGERSNVAFTPAGSDAAVPAKLPPAPAGASVNEVPVQSAPVTKSHQLRLQPQVFEKNLTEKLAGRFVPVRNAQEASGISRYRLPGRDGTDIELVINQQNRVVHVTGSPQMVDSSLQIVRLLDTAEVPGGPVTRFVPVQQSAAEPARRIANLVTQETLRVAQVTPPAVVPAPQPAAQPAAQPGAGEATAGSVLGNVSINIIDPFDVFTIQGTPADVAVVQALLRQLEELARENEPIFELVPMKHADSSRISNLVSQLYQLYYQPRRGPVTFVALVKPNTILLVGRPESIVAAKDLINKLDTPVNPDAGFRIFPLQHAPASLLGPQIQNAITTRPPGAAQGLAPLVTVAADDRINALIVQGSPRDIEDAAAMIRQLDIPAGAKGIDTIVRQFPLKNAVAAELAGIIQTTITTSFQVRSTQVVAGDARSSLLYNVSVFADQRNNRLIVTAPPDAMPVIAALIRELDQPPTAESKIRIFNLVNADAYALTTMLTQMFAPTAGLQATTRPGMEPGDSSLVSIRFLNDVRTNSIIAIGSENDLSVAEAMLIKLDSENQNSRQTYILRMVNSPAEDILAQLTTMNNNERTIDVQSTISLMPKSPLEQYLMEANIVANPITNSLIITASPRAYERIRKIVQELDERPKMVSVEVLIAEINISRNKDWAVELGLQDSLLIDQILPGRNFAFLQGRSVKTQGYTSLNAGSGPVNGGFTFSAAGESVNVFIRALETRNKGQILSRPNLVMLHNTQGSINVGESLPYAASSTQNTAGGNPTVSTDYQAVGTVLYITPRIMLDGMISMAIYVERSSVTEWRDIAGNGTEAPRISETYASTTVNAMDGETVIFAGLITEDKKTTNSSVPGLNKIPVVKHFFENDSKKYEKKELLIVLKPTIIRSRDDLAILNQQERDRMNWCFHDVLKLTGSTGLPNRSGVLLPEEIPNTYGKPIQLNDSQLPKEYKIQLPTLAPEVK
jgi:type II secretory pathway component GspD/PulD (secretin)